VRRLAPFGDRYGVRLAPEPAGEPALLERLSEAVSDRLGRRSAPALLLRDLRSLYTHATGVSADWEMVAQVAQGIRDTDLLALAQRCHPQTLRQAKWANSRIKESATQILVTWWGTGIPPRSPRPASSCGRWPFLAAIEGGPLDAPYAHLKGGMVIDGEYPVSFALTGAAKDARLIRAALRTAGVDDRLTAAVLETTDAAAGRVPDPAAVDVAALVAGLVPGR
jgi:hypothetical protein